jgi:ribosomal protein S18 acetylase RimI-like enzyme
VADLGQSVRFGPLQPDRVDELLALWESAGLKIRRAGREHPERLRAELRDHPNNYIGAFVEEQLVAVVIASWDGRRGWINRLAVHPDLRRKGLGKQLIMRAELELRRRGARVIAVLIEPDNEASLRLFREVGYLDEPAALYLSKRDSLDV